MKGTVWQKKMSPIGRNAASSVGFPAEFCLIRWSAKEAFSKAWGTGIGKLSFQDLEVLNDERGAPVFTKTPFSGKVWVSISHAGTLVMASVILEERDEN